MGERCKRMIGEMQKRSMSQGHTTTTTTAVIFAIIHHGACQPRPACRVRDLLS